MNSELKRRHGLAIDEMDDNDRRWARRVGIVRQQQSHWSRLQAAISAVRRLGGRSRRGAAAVGEAANYWLPGFKHCFDPEPMDRRFF